MATRNQIKATLRDLGIRPNLNGFEYLTDAITIIADDPNVKVTALYANLAKRYDTTPAGIERCMRHAIHKGMETGDVALYTQLFGYTHRVDGYITVSLFIHTLADHFNEEDQA
jgi:hypothetical protein